MHRKWIQIFASNQPIFVKYIFLCDCIPIVSWQADAKLMSAQCMSTVPLKLHGLSVSYLLTYFCKYFQLRATSWGCVNNFLILHDLCNPDQIGFVFAILNWIFNCQIVSDIFISHSNLYGQQVEIIGRGGGCLLVIVEVWSW